MTQEMSKQIEEEALQYAKSIPDCLPHIAYRRGATEWAGKAQGLVDALQFIFRITDPGTPERNAAEKALADYKGKEVTNG